MDNKNTIKNLKKIRKEVYYQKYTNLPTQTKILTFLPKYLGYLFYGLLVTVPFVLSTGLPYLQVLRYVEIGISILILTLIPKIQREVGRISMGEPLEILYNSGIEWIVANNGVLLGSTDFVPDENGNYLFKPCEGTFNSSALEEHTLYPLGTIILEHLKSESLSKS